MLDSFFKLRERGTTARTEIAAGFTTFMTMAYILAVNPGILSASGMEYTRVFAATAITSAVATMIMGLAANLPFALSAGMGLNAFFAYTVCLGMGYSWQWALSAIFIEGIIFILLTLVNAREALIASIPPCLKKAIGAGIGLYIAYIGLQHAGIVVPDASTASALSTTWYKGASGVAMIGLAVTAVLMIRKVPGSLLIGIIVTTLIGIPFGVTHYAGGSYLPAAPYFAQFAFRDIVSSGKSIFDFIVVTFTFLFVDLFDTVGTLIACAGKSGLIREDGTIPRCKQALFADSVGTTVGSLLGTSTVTTFVESASGVAAGARTGLASLTVSVLFLLSLFLSPLFASIPSAATAPALIIVGVLMVTPVMEINFADYTEGIPAFMTIIIMVCAYSISDGIMFGILFYVILMTAAKRVREINPATWVLVLLFGAKVAAQALL